MFSPISRNRIPIFGVWRRRQRPVTTTPVRHFHEFSVFFWFSWISIGYGIKIPKWKIWIISLKLVTFTIFFCFTVCSVSPWVLPLFGVSGWLLGVSVKGRRKLEKSRVIYDKTEHKSKKKVKYTITEILKRHLNNSDDCDSFINDVLKKYNLQTFGENFSLFDYFQIRNDFQKLFSQNSIF